MLSKPFTNGSSSVVCETFSLFSPYHMQQVKQYHLRRELCQPSTSLRLDKRHWRTFNKPFRALHNALLGFKLPMSHLALIEYKETADPVPYTSCQIQIQETGSCSCWSELCVVWHLFAFARLLKWHVGVVELCAVRDVVACRSELWPYGLHNYMQRDCGAILNAKQPRLVLSCHCRWGPSSERSSYSLSAVTPAFEEQIVAFTWCRGCWVNERFQVWL